MLSLARRIVSRGYGYRVPDFDAEAVFVARSVAGPFEVLERDALIRRHEGRLRGGIAVILPTVLSRAPLAEHRSIAAHLIEQLAAARRCLPGTSILFCLGVQHEDAREAAIERVIEVLSSECAGEDGRPRDLIAIGVALPKLHKVVTLNAAFAVLRHFGLAGIGWADDDVTFGEDAWALIAGDFLAHGARGAAGAVKQGQAGAHRAARVLHRLKQITQPATGYPHGCAILVDARLVAGGIPRRYISDDGFVCFENLRPDRRDPLEQLRLVEGARCFHVVGGPAGQTFRRLRRMLINHAVFLADYPSDVSRTYFRELLFHGLWPLAPFDRSRGALHGVQKLSIKLVYFGWFAAICAELFARGVAGRPLRDVRWNGYAALERPR